MPADGTFSFKICLHPNLIMDNLTEVKLNLTLLMLVCVIWMVLNPIKNPTAPPSSASSSFIDSHVKDKSITM